VGTRADRTLSDEDLRQQIESTRQRLGADVKSLARSIELEVGQAVSRGSEQIQGRVGELGGSVSATIAEIGTTLDRAIGQLRSHVDVRAAVRREPFKGVAVATALGILGGLFLGRSKGQARAAQHLLPAGAAHSVPAVAAVVGHKLARASPLGALVMPLLIELARTGAGRALEQMVERGVLKARQRLHV
jgi:ElaB/YqjD/DUF883 family membrane-anchored ribosome-binding protein